jgi:hypothetical protein
MCIAKACAALRSCKTLEQYNNCDQWVWHLNERGVISNSNHIVFLEMKAHVLDRILNHDMKKRRLVSQHAFAICSEGW